MRVELKKAFRSIGIDLTDHVGPDKIKQNIKEQGYENLGSVHQPTVDHDDNYIDESDEWPENDEWSKNVE